MEKAEQFVLALDSLQREQRAAITLQRFFRKWKMRRHRRALLLLGALRRAVRRGAWRVLKGLPSGAGVN